MLWVCLAASDPGGADCIFKPEDYQDILEWKCHIMPENWVWGERSMQLQPTADKDGWKESSGLDIFGGDETTAEKDLKGI